MREQPFGKEAGDWSGDLSPGRHLSTQIVCRGSRGTLSEGQTPPRPFPHHRAGFPVPRGEPRGLPVSMRGSAGDKSPAGWGRGWGAAREDMAEAAGGGEGGTSHKGRPSGQRKRGRRRERERRGEAGLHRKEKAPERDQLRGAGAETRKVERGREAGQTETDREKEETGVQRG